MFPLYKDDGKAIIKLTETQKKTIQIVKDKIISGEYILVKNSCLCKNKRSNEDIIIAEKDRFGMSVSNILCGKCGLIRSAEVFDQTSTIEFYKNDYRSMYIGSKRAPESFFNDQIIRGNSFLNLFKDHVSYNNRSLKFLEIGCGAGGILYPFSKFGHSCSGVDYDENYLEFGISKGLNLLYGDYNHIIEDDSVDVLILSHVLEHFLEPIVEMQSIIKKVKLGGYFIIEVPGVFYINKTYINPLLYLQNIHVFNYYYYYLKVFFEQLGLQVIYGDERCTFILQKPKEWRDRTIELIYDPSLAEYPKKIRKYLVKVHLKYIFYMNRKQWQNTAVKFLDVIGLKEIVKRSFKR